MDGENYVFLIPSVLVIQNFNGFVDKKKTEVYPNVIRATLLDKYLRPSFTSFLSKSNEKETEIWYVPTHLRTKEFLCDKESLRTRIDPKYYIGSTFITLKDWDGKRFYRSLSIQLAEASTHPVFRLKTILQ